MEKNVWFKLWWKAKNFTYHISRLFIFFFNISHEFDLKIKFCGSGIYIFGDKLYFIRGKIFLGNKKKTNVKFIILVLITCDITIVKLVMEGN